MQRFMLVLSLSPLLLLLVMLLGCTGGGGGGEFCGLSEDAPSSDDVGSGAVSADRDGSPFATTGTWRPPPGGSWTGGSLDVIMENDEDGNDTADLIAAATFPICVPIGARAENSGQANYVDGGFVSTDNDGGFFSILGEEAGEIFGRFSFTLATPGGETTVFSDGMYRVPRR